MEKESERPDPHPIVSEVEIFLVEFGLSRNSLDNVMYKGFTKGLIEGRRQPQYDTILKIAKFMEDARAEEPQRMEAAAKVIDKFGGYITMSPGGQIQSAPASVPIPRLRRMMDAGLLVPTGDTLLAEVPSQTYKLSSVAQ